MAGCCTGWLRIRSMWSRATSIVVCALLAACGGPEFRGVEEQPSAPPAPAVAQERRFDPGQELPGTDGAAPPAATSISWPDLRGLQVQSGKASEKLERLNGSTVKLAGYMVPFSDDLESVTEFLLVPAAGLCVHKPAPPSNQIVFVRMSAGTARVDWSTAVEVTGAFHIDEEDSPFGKASFRIAATAANKW